MCESYVIIYHIPLGPIRASIFPGLASPHTDQRILLSATSTQTSLNDKPDFAIDASYKIHRFDSNCFAVLIQSGHNHTRIPLSVRLFCYSWVKYPPSFHLETTLRPWKLSYHPSLSHYELKLDKSPRTYLFARRKCRSILCLYSLYDHDHASPGPPRPFLHFCYTSADPNTHAQ